MKFPKEAQIMLDLETLGCTHDAAVVQIGLVAFNADGILEKSFVNIDVEDAMNCGEVDASTLQFWFSQKLAGEVLFGGNRTTCQKAAVMVNAFIKKYYQKGTKLWCHGTFDAPILDNMYKVVGIKPLLKYYEVSDLRTIYSLVRKATVKREGRHHHAMDDAVYQVEQLLASLKQDGVI